MAFQVRRRQCNGTGVGVEGITMEGEVVGSGGGKFDGGGSKVWLIGGCSVQMGWTGAFGCCLGVDLAAGLPALTLSAGTGAVVISGFVVGGQWSRCRFERSLVKNGQSWRGRGMPPPLVVEQWVEEETLCWVPWYPPPLEVDQWVGEGG
jgi:hypothetical protein